MSEQIREQISAFLDGELPAAESELLLKRLLRDTQLRDSFGRYALIGEAMRGSRHMPLGRDFTSAVNGAIDGGAPALPAAGNATVPGRRWWRPVAGGAVAASVAVVAIVALQQRALAPGITSAANTSTAPHAGAVPASVPLAARSNREALAYTVPAASGAPPNAIAGARLTNYVFAHSQYPSLLGQRDVMTDLIVDVDQPAREADASVAR